MILQVDTNGDGLIQFNEFCRVNINQEMIDILTSPVNEKTTPDFKKNKESPANDLFSLE